jgi:GNAT superfamily N-acetyltransferase
VEIRPVREADYTAIAKIADASDEVAEPDYVAHIAITGSCLVAELDGEVVGYTAVHPVGEITMLADLFILPAHQGKGIGRLLLDHVFTGTGPDRMTCASADPRALPLYVRYGMVPRWPLLYMTGPVIGTEPADRVPPAEAARAELELTGTDRSSDYSYWGGTGILVGHHGAGVARPGQLIHFAATRDPELSLLAALAAVPDDPASPGLVSLHLPGPHPALRTLLESGWRITDQDRFMSSREGLAGTASVLSPALGLELEAGALQVQLT